MSAIRQNILNKPPKRNERDAREKEATVARKHPLQPTKIQSAEQMKKLQTQRRPHGGRAAMMSGEKAKNFGATMKQLLGYLKVYKWRIGLTMLFAIASTIFAIMSPKILGQMTNQIVDDYIKIKAHDAVVKQLPKGTQITKGTTITDLVKQMQTAASAQIAEQQAAIAQLPPEQQTAASAKLETQIKDAKNKSDQQAQQMKDVTAKLTAEQRKTIETMDMSQTPQMNYGKLGGIALWLIVLYLLAAGFGYAQGWLMTGVTQAVSYRFRRDISQKINRLPLRYFDREGFGDVLSRITNDVDMISQSLSQSLSQMITSLTMIVGIVGMMLSINVSLTGVAIAVVLISFIGVGQIVKRTQPYFKAQQDNLGLLNDHIEEIYAGHQVVKAFNGEQKAIKEFSHWNEKLHHVAWKSQFLSGLMMPMMNFIGNLGYAATAVLGGYFAIHGKISIGDIQAFIQYVSQFNQPIVQVANIANVIQSTAASAERVFEFLAEPDETPDPVDAPLLNRATGAVNFANVKFGYDPGKTIIHDFSAAATPGQTIAIVGPTGAGKTTLVNLLMRFYDPDSGQIKIDGVSTMSLPRANVREQFAMVLQDTWLFSGTIRENLAYGKLDATDAEIQQAAAAAHIDHFIRSLPHGYDTELSEDAENISAGEKQLLTIARAMLADAPMLILDEATSNVDTRTEILIQSAMRKLMKGRTSFVIAHRLSTIRDADLILVINHGDIIEQGTHRELLRKNGFYAQLYNAQFAE
jgi:ATP-binding cassette subfamily B protein